MACVAEEALQVQHVPKSLFGNSVLLLLRCNSVPNSLVILNAAADMMSLFRRLTACLRNGIPIAGSEPSCLSVGSLP